MDNTANAEMTENERAVIGGNLPPSPIEILRAELETETATLRARADELVETANEMKVEDKGGAERATALAKMLRDHANDIDKAREARKRDPLEMCRLIDATFKSIHEPLVGPDPKKPAGLFATLLAQINVFRKAEEEKAAAERRRLEYEAHQQRLRAEKAEADAREAQEREQRAKEEAAAAVLRAAEDAERARAAGDREAQLRAQRDLAVAQAQRDQAEREAREREHAAGLTASAATAQADRLEARAATTTAAPLDSGYGAKAFGRKVPTFEITDFSKALLHARKVDPATIEAAVRDVITRQMKAKVRIFPGVEFSEESKTVIR